MRKSSYTPKVPNRFRSTVAIPFLSMTLTAAAINDRQRNKGRQQTHNRSRATDDERRFPLTHNKFLYFAHTHAHTHARARTHARAQRVISVVDKPSVVVATDGDWLNDVISRAQ